MSQRLAALAQRVARAASISQALRSPSIRAAAPPPPPHRAQASARLFASRAGNKLCLRDRHSRLSRTISHLAGAGAGGTLVRGPGEQVDQYGADTDASGASNEYEQQEQLDDGPGADAGLYDESDAELQAPPRDSQGASASGEDGGERQRRGWSSRFKVPAVVTDERRAAQALCAQLAFRDFRIVSAKGPESINNALRISVRASRTLHLFSGETKQVVFQPTQNRGQPGVLSFYMYVAAARELPEDSPPLKVGRETQPLRLVRAMFVRLQQYGHTALTVRYGDAVLVLFEALHSLRVDIRRYGYDVAVIVDVARETVNGNPMSLTKVKLYVCEIHKPMNITMEPLSNMMKPGLQQDDEYTQEASS